MPFEAKGHLAIAADVVVVNMQRLIEIGYHEVEIAIAIEVTHGCGIAHAEVVQPPGFGNVLKLQATLVSIGKIAFTLGVGGPHTNQIRWSC